MPWLILNDTNPADNARMFGELRTFIDQMMGYPNEATGTESYVGQPLWHRQNSTWIAFPADEYTLRAYRDTTRPQIKAAIDAIVPDVEGNLVEALGLEWRLTPEEIEALG